MFVTGRVDESCAHGSCINLELRVIAFIDIYCKCSTILVSLDGVATVSVILSQFTSTLDFGPHEWIDQFTPAAL